MKIKAKQKLNLIDNYVAIYRILYNCKMLMQSSSATGLSSIQKLCDQTLDLKTKYETAFEKFKMIDDSFLLLKKQLTDCKIYTDKYTPTCTIKEITDSISIIQSDYLKLKL